MKRLGLILCLLWISFAVTGQSYDTVESIPVLLAKLSKQTSLEGKLKLLNELSFAYGLTFQTDSSLYYASTALVLAEKYQLKSQMAEAHRYSGMAIQRLGNHLEAITELESALALADKDLDKNLISETNFAIGYSYYILKSHYKAIEQHLLNIKYAQDHKVYNNLLMVYNNMGLIYMDLEMLDSALYYFNIELQSAHLPNYDLGAMSANKNIGRAYLLQGKDKEGIEYIWKSIKIAERSKSVHVQNTALLGYQCLAEYEFEHKNYTRTLEYALKALAIATKFNITDDTIELTELLFKTYAKMSNVEKALEYMNLNYKANALMNARLLKSHRQALDNRLQVAKQRMDINLLDQENKRSKQQILWVIGGLIVMSLVGIWLFILYKKVGRQKHQIDLNNILLEQKVIERTKELENAYFELEGAIVKGQTIERKRISSDIHDNLGGILSSASIGMEAMDLTPLSTKERRIVKLIKNQISNAYDEIRLLSHNLRPDVLETNGIKIALKRMAGRIKLLHHIDFTIELKFSKTLRKTTEFHIYFIATEFLNNVLKHARATKIKLSLLDAADDKIMLLVEDNGIGFDAATTGKSNNGIGLLSVQERLDQIGGKMTYFSEPGKTVFKILID